jgi:hypothetical protein
MLNRTGWAITGCMRSAPITPLIVEAGILPVMVVGVEVLGREAEGSQPVV